jgi:two-component system LytT family response regulator
MKILIVDDERPARAKLRRLLEPEPGVEIVGEAASGADAVARICADAPDLVFLDIQMPGMDGFGVIDAVGLDRMPHVVFATAYDEHALRAFEARALDYLLKPFAPARFKAVLDHVRQVMARGRRAEDQDRLAYLVPVARIDSIVSARNDLVLRAGGETFEVRGTLTEIASRLDPQQFLQISRSAIVRLDAVKELQPWFHGDYKVVLGDGRVLSWSRRFRARSRGAFEL